MRDDPRSTIGYPNERCTSLHPQHEFRCQMSRGHPGSHRFIAEDGRCVFFWPQTDRNGNPLPDESRDSKLPIVINLRQLALQMIDEPDGDYQVPSDIARAMGVKLLNLLDANAEGR